MWVAPNTLTFVDAALSFIYGLYYNVYESFIILGSL